MHSYPSPAQQLRLLRAEYDFEKEAFRRDAQLTGVERKVRRGDCWYPVTVGRAYYNSLDRFVVEILSTATDDVPHNFEYGRPVAFFERDGSGGLRFLPFRCTVSYAEAARMVVDIPGEAALSRLQQAELLGVQLAFDDYTYRVMMDALSHVIAARDGRLAYLRDLFHTDRQPSFAAAGSLPPSLPWLNASQQQAVSDVLTVRDVLIIHGPPGTGKTTTLVDAVCETLRREPQVMVCAQSNTAVDWISKQLADRGVSVLRIGNPAKVTDEMLAATYERRFEAHPDYPQLWQIRRTIRQLYSLPRKGRGDSFHQKVSRLRDRADELELRIRHALFDGARVIASTLTGAAHPLLHGHHFHTLFIDEAAQALEAACWIALAHADRVILAGDHCQLPPTVKSPEALRGGLAVTLMELLAASKPAAVRLLNVQYRMNEELMRFSSHWFYADRLVAAPEVRHRSLLDELDHPLVWIDTSPTEADAATEGAPPCEAREEYVGATFGRINKVEAQLTVAALCSYVERFGRERLMAERTDFGVISPYRAQVQYLRGLIKRHDTLRPLRRAITVDTVDAFQGQERDVVVVSLVRANDEGQIGFLADLRRMNVAMTRARFKLILLGASATLCRHRFYRELYRSCKVERPPGAMDANLADR